MADEYWDIIQAIWNQVNIYDSPEAFKKQFSKLNEKQKVLYAKECYTSRLVNGPCKDIIFTNT